MREYVLSYWGERLRQEKLFWDERLYMNTLYIPNPEDQSLAWPRKVLLDAIYEDFLAWYADQQKRQADPEAAVFCSRLQFFSWVGPCIYRDRRRQKIKRLVHFNRPRMGGYVPVKEKMTYVRLFSVAIHRDMLEALLDANVET